MLHQLFLTLTPANLGNGNNGSSTTPPPFELPNPIPQLFEDNGKTFNINFPDGSNPASPTTYDIVTGPTGPLTVVIWIASSPGAWSRGSNWLGGEQPTSPQEVEILTPIKVTADGNDSAAGLVIVSGATVNIVSGATLTIFDFIHGGGTIQLNSSGSDPTLAIDGAVSLVGGGTIDMIGTAGEDNILGVPGSHALLINVDYTIEGTGTIGGGDGNLTFENFGTVNGNAGLLTIDTGNQVYNDGLMEATADPLAATAGTLQIKDSVVNAGTVQADGIGAAVTLSGATFDNLFSVVAKNGGSVTFTNVAVTNEAVGATDPAGGTINATGGTITFNGGSIANGNVLEATNGGILQLENITVTNSSAGSATTDASSTVVLDNAAIFGGTIDNAGHVDVTAGSSTLNGETVSNSGTITVETGASLTLEGDTLTNTASGTIDADSGSIDIEINNANTINNGLIEAVDGGAVTIDVNADGSSNHGTIEADNGTVVINNNIGGGGGGSASGGNFGTIEAINGGTVDINGGITNRAGATIEANDPGSTVDFSEGQTKNLGTIEATGVDAQVNFTSGMVDNFNLIIAESDGAISFISVMITNEAGAMVEATSGGSIGWMTGGVDNSGTFDADNGTITFAGSIGITNETGGIFEASNGGSITFGTSGTGSVTNASGGLIEALSGGTITFDSSLNGAQNTGTIVADAGGTTIIDGFSGGNGLSNDGGIIEATGTAAVVQLASATIIGGTLETSGGGVIEAASGTNTLLNVTFDGGVLQVDTGAIVDLSGGSSGIALVVDGTVTFQGGGTVELDFSSYKIVAGAGGGTLDNATTIEGAGQIGAGDGLLTLNNQTAGTIDADISGATLTIDTGNTVTNAGTLEATNGGTLQIDDCVDNESTGVIVATGTGSTVSITFNGGGVNNCGLEEAVAGGTLNLTDDSGGVGNSHGGTIEADAGTVSITGGIDNNGMVEAVDGGTLTITIDNTNNNNGGVGNFGTIKADGGTVSIVATVSDAIVLNSAAGTIEAIDCGVVSISGVTINNAGGIVALNGGSVTIKNSTLDNSGGEGATGVGTNSGGTITIDCSHVVNCGVISSAGSGAITIEDSNVCNNGEIGADTGGTITFERSHIVNNNHIGTGDNLGPSTGPIGTIIFDRSYVVNNGSFDSGHNGEIDIDCSTIDNTSGTIQTGGPDGGNSSVHLSNATIIGGTIATLTGGFIEAVCGTSTLDGVTISDGTFIQANCGTFLDLEDTTTLNGTVMFEGAGTFVLDPGAASIVGGASGGTLDIASGATLTGSGDIGNAGATALTLNNSGTIDANVCGATLDIETGNTVTNLGLLEATNGGTLEIDDDIENCGGTIEALTCGTINLNGTKVYNRNGSIEADGFGAAIMLAGAIIIGGTLETSAHGIIETVADSGNTTFDGVTIAAGSNVQVSDDTTLTLQDTIDCNGTVTNDGTITLVQGCHSSLIINGNITLAGNGTVVLSGDSDSIVGTGTGANTLHNANTIEGSGTIGGDDLVFINQACGIVDADMCGHTLVLDTDTTVINLGLLEATNGGTLEIEDSVCNVGGTIAASGCGSIVDLVGVTITGGTLETSCGGLIETTGTSLLNVTIADGGTLEAGTGATFLLEGATTVSDPVTFKGGGTFELSGDDAKIVGSGDNADLHNYATIAGAGTIGNCALSVTNECSGIIDATGCLTINLAPNTLTNDGLMEATGGGELSLLSTVSNFNVIAAYAGSTVYLDDFVSNSDCGQVIASGHCAVVDLFNATISGGTIKSDCGGLIQTVAGFDDAATTSTFDGVTIGCDSDVKVADHTTLILEDGTTMFGGRLSIACSGVVDVEHGGNDGCGGATFDGVNVIDNGALDIGDVNSGAILTLDDGTTITGHGTGTLTINAYNTLDVEHGSNFDSGGATLDGMNVTDNGALDIGDVTSGAILTLDDGTTITGHGTGNLTINAYNTLDVEHGGNDGGGGATLDGIHVINNGALDIGDVASGAILTLDDGTTVTGHGTSNLTINAYNTLDVEHGGNEGSGGATLDGVHVTDNGALDVGDAGSGAILALDGGTTVSGCGAMTINACNTLDVDGGTTTIDLGGTITNNGTLEASCGGELDVVSHVDNSSGTLEADSGGKLDIQSAICGGTATIHGGTLEFGAASSVNVTFNNGDSGQDYGKLVLDDVTHFTGQIYGFDGTAAGSCTSDTVELKGFCETSYSVQCCNGNEILTLHDGDRCVTLTFDDFNQSFKIEDIGGNTYIYDPPATGSKDAPSTTPATTTATPTTTTTSAGSDHTAVPADNNGSGNDHAVTSAPGTPPTLAENSFGASGNDSFTFHPNLGNDTAHDTGAQTTELAHGNIQGAAPALAPIALEFHQEFAFDAIHQDAASIGAIVDQFHQMATNSTLLH